MQALIHDEKSVSASLPGEDRPLVSGESARLLAKAFAPKPGEVRQMLIKLRKRYGWSQADAARALGVTTSAVVKWEGGDREANGAAAKLIFLLHTLLIDAAGKVKNVQDLAFWGHNPQKAIENGASLLLLESNLPEGCQVPKGLAAQPPAAPIEVGNTEKISRPLSRPERLAVLGARAAVLQKCLGDAILKIHEEIMILRNGKGQKRQLCELSVEFATLSARLCESIELSLKLAGGPPNAGELDRLAGNEPLVPSFTPGSIVKP
jgi:DNA-binding transcriptional regulator YiaG